MEKLAEEQGTLKFDVSFIISNFSDYYQQMFKDMADKKGYTGKIYHPMIRLKYNGQYLYFDWLTEGFSIRDALKFYIEDIKNTTKIIFAKILYIFLNFY